MDPVLDRVMSKISKSISGCWIWTGGHTGNGYPNVKISGENIYSYIFLWEEKYGTLNPGMRLDRLCENRSCCNPDHYRIKSKNDKNKFARELIVIDIKAGLKRRDILDKYKCSAMTYHRIKKAFNV